MAQIQISNVPRHCDVDINTTLDDNGVALDWTSLSDIRALAYSVEQKAVACILAATIDESDSTKLKLRYNADDPQYLGVCKVVIRCTYDGRIKTYDQPAFNFVATTAEGTGVVTLDDPVVNVHISVEDVSTSLLDDAINAAFAAAAKAEALEARAPYIDETTGDWFVFDVDSGEYVDSGVHAEGPQGPQGEPGNYTKPASGIPKSDLAAGVKQSLEKADSALQQPQEFEVGPDQYLIISCVEVANLAIFPEMDGRTSEPIFVTVGDDKEDVTVVGRKLDEVDFYTGLKDSAPHIAFYNNEPKMGSWLGIKVLLLSGTMPDMVVGTDGDFDASPVPYTDARYLYAKPSTGIPATDFTSAVQAVLRDAARVVGSVTVPSGKALEIQPMSNSTLLVVGEYHGKRCSLLLDNGIYGDNWATVKDLNGLRDLLSDDGGKKYVYSDGSAFYLVPSASTEFTVILLGGSQAPTIAVVNSYTSDQDYDVEILEAYGKPADGIPAEDLDEEVQDALELASTAVQPAALEIYAKKDEPIALSENMINTRGAGTEQEFLFRKACGDQRITDVGNALVKQILGRTLVWNQLVQVSNTAADVYGITRTKVDDYTLHYQGTCSQTAGFTGTLIYSVVAGHKYYVAAKGNLPDDVKVVGGVGLPVSGGKQREIVAATSTASNSTLGIRIHDGTQINADVNFTSIDLTLMFGDGKEPSTVAEFEALYNAKYYAANAGTLLSNKAAAIETVGFNQWDEETRNGYYNNIGVWTNNAGYTSNKNPIPVLPSTNYCIYSVNGNLGRLCIYDEAGTFISTALMNSNPYTFTTPANAAFIAFDMESAYGGTYNHDICLNLSDAAKNGTYEPYWKHTMNLDLTTLTGKLNGEGESVVVAPDGLRSAGSIQDYGVVENGYLTKIVRATGQVDLGTLDWLKTGAGNFFSTPPNIKSSAAAISSKYPYGGSSTDKSLWSTGAAIYIKDSDYTDAAAFKTAVSGVKLIYELATPLVYVLDHPIPVMYPVAELGTEKVLPEGVDTNGVPKTAPFRAVTRYSTNYPQEVDNLMDTLDALTALIGTLHNGTVTRTWDATTGKYVYVFTPNS